MSNSSHHHSKSNAGGTGEHAHSAPRSSACEPIAIIGMGCRLPGGCDNLQQYWNLLENGVDAISETPEDRWNLEKFYSAKDTKPGKTQSRWGGYVDNLDQFDPQLFGISPREAAGMDPQQRLLLEVAYRAIEDAGQPTERVAGEPVSVFVGISSFDYAVAGLSFQDRGVINAYSNTGGSSSIAANRISYCFDLRGPSVAVDTACSSSLVAVHMACESIWRGDAKMALAGGVNALILPDFYVAFSQLGVLSPDGRCKTFDARANGYVRSEGAGMVMLKPLSAALRDKDPIYAAIRATALNQDGRTPGMTVPSQTAQESLLRAACAKANVRPEQLQYVEAHGTGTPVGDPIEARALGSVLGQNRSQDNCWIGSVKTNIGHLEAGAGIASLMKVALSLHHRRIPKHLHFENANAEIDFDQLKLRVPTETQVWSSDDIRLAGINGFGYGGANAHVILQEAPNASRKTTELTQPRSVSSSTKLASDASARLNQADDEQPEERLVAPVLLPISARSKSAVLQIASETADWLEQNTDLHLAEIAGYLAHRRSHQSVRTTACALTTQNMIAELRTLAASTPEEFAEDFGTAKIARGPVFVCSGQGPQWWAMGRGLLKYSPAFRSVIKQCDVEFSKYGEWSLIEELTRDEAESRMQRTSIAQPCIFALQVALAAVWRSWGIQPSAIVGHSVGEIAAAYLAGALDWTDACRVAFHRGRTMDLASSHGAMVAAGLSPDEVPQWIEGLEEEVSIAAINGPSSVTISGDADAIEDLALRLEEAGIFCRRLAVEYAFHSPQMEPVKDELLQSLRDIRPRTVHTPLISTVSGTASSGLEFGAEYWWQNVRQSVRFSDAMHCLASDGYGIAIEIGPHPVLAYAINECFQASGHSVRTVPSLSRQMDDLQCMAKSLGSLYSLGFEIDWSGFYNQPTRKLPIPTYPFQTIRCWSESLESTRSRLKSPVHPLLGEKTDASAPCWQNRLDLKLQDYLADHRVRGAVVYPAAAMIETALAASMELHNAESASLERVRLHSPCMLADDHPQWIESNFDAERRQLRLSVRDCSEEAWSQLATIDLSADLPTSANAVEEDFVQNISDIRDRCTEGFDSQRLYSYCESLGLNYGPRFSGVVSGLRRNGESLIEINLGNHINGVGYYIHPALLDSCFHSMIAADPIFDHTVDGLYLPVEIRQFCYYRSPGLRVTVHTRLKSKTRKFLICDLDIFDERGQLCATIRDFKSMRVAGGLTAESTEDLIYSYSWIEQDLESEGALEPGSPKRWLVFMDEAGLGKELGQQITARGDLVTEVFREQSSVPQAAEGFYQVNPESKSSFVQLLRDLRSTIDNTSSDGHDQPDSTVVDHVVYLWGLDVPTAEALTTENLDASTHLTTLAPLYLVQAWEEIDMASDCCLALVTQGAQSADGEPEAASVAQAPLVGFGRVVVSECGRLTSKLVDLPSSNSPIDVDCLLSELLADDGEDEVMWRNGRRYVHRFSPQAGKPASADAATRLPCQLRVGDNSGIEELHYETKSVLPLAPGEVEIEVFASGLNFSDVMKALDLYPGLPDGPVDLGAECSGRISRIAEGSRWSVGDEVIAVAPGSFGSHVTVDELLVAPKPSNLTHEQAAAIPIAFLTAEYALLECAALTAGESVLIHSASGGVGLAAMQVAKLNGIRILATAGTDEKRRLVRQKGAAHVMDSRSLAFSQATLKYTNGIGVDAVLNSLPGEAIAKGIATLKTGGRFLEIGKRDVYNDGALGLFPFRNNLSLHVIDLDQLFKLQPAKMGAMLSSLVPRFESGELQPLPVTEFSADETVAAYRFMQQGKHTGKVVVTYDERPTRIQNGTYAPLTLDADGTYWVAGGLGGFGLQISRWLVDRGARHLVLSGRSRTLRPEAERVLGELASSGASITVVPADITKADDVRSVLATIDEQLPPLKGIIHTAMVLEDKLLVDLDRKTLERVLRPKVLGGWNLHQQSQGYDLDLFVLFSSLSSVFGHAGQANYSAANAALDSLATYRRAIGLPATVMNWGHLGEVGYLAEREELGQRLERQGVLSFTVEQATNCLEYAIQTQALQLSVLRMDWTRWRGLGITNRVSPRFAHLIRNAGDANELSGADISAASLRSTSRENRLATVDRLLRTKSGLLLGLAADQIQADRALLEMGLDSLMAVEMRNWIENQFEIALPISVLMRSDSLTQVTESICDLLSDSAASDSSQAAGPAAAKSDESDSTVSDADAETLLQKLPELDADEVSALLSQMLREQN